LDYVELNGKRLLNVKRLGEKGLKYKKLTVLVETEAGNLDLKFRLHKGDPHLKVEQIKINGDYQQHQMKLKTSNHENQSVISTSFQYDGSIKFFQINLNRPSATENFQFNCLILKSQTFEFGRIFEKLTVEFKRKQGRVLLENITETLRLKPYLAKEYPVKGTDPIIDLNEFGAINFSDILSVETNIDVRFRHDEDVLPASVVGKVTLDPIKLPSILDKQRAKDIHLLEGNAQYNENTQRAIVSGKEKELSVNAKRLCRLENKYLSESLMYINEQTSEVITIRELGEEFSEITNAYQEMFSWLKEKETVISLSSWPKEFTKLVKNILDAVSKELATIPCDSLSDRYRKLLKVGVFHGALSKNDTPSDWFTPYHPLNLAYAYQLINKLEETGCTIEDIPDTTLDKLNPAGLIPIIYDLTNSFAFTIPSAHNRLWLQVVPQKQNNHEFVIKLVQEKINDFTSCFDMLFRNSKTAPLLINSIHNQSNKFIFSGIAAYFKTRKHKAKKIHITLYDDKLYKCYFDIFAESKNIEEQRALIRNSDKDKAEIIDEIIAIMRNNLSYSKVTKGTEYRYAHIAFYKNNEKVEVKDKLVNNANSGLACQGLISGEASYLENGNYYTGFGLKGIEGKSCIITIAEKYNALLKPFKDPTASYIEGVVPVLVVKDTFKTQLRASYISSIWTCIIDPKVTLDFFDDKNTILVHYSDQYTNSIAYDAITVSSRVDLYKGLLKEDSDELVNSFNAVSGQWLLDIVKSAGKLQSKTNEKQLKEKQGIIAAYKFLASFLLNSDITWVPLSIAELIRVTGNVGLKIKDSDFSARLQNKKKGAMSDDMLFVGFKEGVMYLLPLEVKTREKGNDFTKAIEQAYELASHMHRLLAPNTFKGQVYRALFIQHIMSQIERFELYKIFPQNYFKLLKEERSIYQQGNYRLLAIEKYVAGFAIALNNNKESSRLNVNVHKETNILTIELPLGLMKALQSQSLRTLSDKLTSRDLYPELAPYILSATNNVAIDYKEKISHTVLDSDVAASDDNEVFSTVSNVPIALFDYSPEFKGLVDTLLDVYDRNLSLEDIDALTESGFVELLNADDKSVLNFYRLKEMLFRKNCNDNETHELLDNSPDFFLNNLMFPQNYQALYNFITRAFGENITVQEVINLTEQNLLDQNGFGRAKLAKFEEFRDALKNNNFSVSNNKQTELLENYDIPLDELEIELITSLDKYLDTAIDREKDIFIRRLGLGCEGLTLEEIGQKHNITRERVRQIEKKAKQNFLAHLTVTQNVIKVVIQINLSELRDPLFKKLRNRFSNRKQFYAFLEISSGLEDNAISHITSPDISRDYLNEFWITNKSPAPLDELTWNLHEILNIEIAVAENQVLRWRQDGYLAFKDELVKPLKLPKVEAIANTLLEFPCGETWLTIQNKAIEKKISTAVFVTGRVEPSFMKACDREYIYQSNRGTYRHLKFLDISEKDIEHILDRVKTKLQEYRYSGRNSLNLAVDIYDENKFTQDYFIVRHIVRTYGETRGIFFNGKSGSDTISLNSEFNLASQKLVLADLFRSTLKPITKSTVASKIRSKSLGHAAFYMDKLLTEGTIVRVDETHFAHIDNAFNDIDIASILNQVIEFLAEESRIVEGESLQTYINRQLSLELNKYFYLSLLKAKSSEYGLDLHFAYNLISTKPICKPSLAEFCRTALESANTNNEALELIKQKICAHDHVIRRCLHQVNIKNSTETPLVKLKHQHNEININASSTNHSEINKVISIESCRVLIGKAVDNADDVYWEYGNKNLANRHLIIFGQSGQGKTYCLQGLLMELAKFTINSMVIDYTNGFRPEHLEPEFKETVNPRTDLIAHKPIDINPFKKQKSSVAGIELTDKSHDIAARITAVFNSVFSSIGEQQLATLIRVIESGLDLYDINYDFTKMLDDLEAHDQTGVKLANKLMPIVKANIFSCSENNGWENIYSSNESICRIIQMATLSRDVWRSATEFILWDLYSYACLFGKKYKPLPVVLDEVQNLDHRLDSPLAKMLTEGRKYGLSLILATQTLSNLKKEEQDRLFQSAHKLFFAPAETEIQSYAKLLEQAIPAINKKSWLIELANLKKGECISVGLHMDSNGNVVQSARVVRVASLEARI
jgi:DNA phosphorothioation-dependent restriction protein DptH